MFLYHTKFAVTIDQETNDSYNRYRNLFFSSNMERGLQMKAFIDYEQGEVVFGGLLRAYKHKVFPYDVIDLPQDLVPDAIKDEPLTHSRFMFYVCHYMRGGIKSSLAVQQLVKLWEYDPYLFQPWFAQKRDPEELEGVLKRYNKYKDGELSLPWPKNSARVRFGMISDATT